MRSYDPYDWHWIIAGDTSKAWSSRSSQYVTQWPPDAVTRIANLIELRDVLAAYGLRGPLITVEDVAAERERRLSGGFDYNFGDARGVHRIGTTEADRKGWSEVSDYADALLALGDATTTINIVTNTGACQVTAPEWMAIKIKAAEFRQPIWAKSFALMALNPIPADYASDARWS